MQSRQFPVEQLDDSTEECSLTAGSGSNMLVAVRLRPLNSKEIAGGCKSCCKVINGKVRVVLREDAMCAFCAAVIHLFILFAICVVAFVRRNAAVWLCLRRL